MRGSGFSITRHVVFALTMAGCVVTTHDMFV